MARSTPDTIPEAYQADHLADAYRRGWNHGHGIACHNVPELGETYRTDADGRIKADAESIRDVHASLCHAAADNARSYSPFEYTASAFNASEFLDELWEAFEAGTADAIAADLAEYTDEDYGIPEADPIGLDDFFQGYVDCAIWASTDDEGNPLDDNYDEDDIAEATLAEMREDCADFLRANAADVAEMMRVTGRPMDHMGHDFWLTRNSHGAGFWDRGAGDVGDRLSKASKVYSGVDLYIGDDGKVHA